jgi:hypothetical protein
MRGATYGFGPEMATTWLGCASSRDEIPTRRVDGRYECRECGELLAATVQTEPEVVLMVSASSPTVRTLRLEGVEVHRCNFS